MAVPARVHLRHGPTPGALRPKPPLLALKDPSAPHSCPQVTVFFWSVRRPLTVKVGLSSLASKESAKILVCIQERRVGERREKEGREAEAETRQKEEENEGEGEGEEVGRAEREER